MGSDAFYATAAQVLPTLLIALSVEVGLIMQVFSRELNEIDETKAEARTGKTMFVANTSFIQRSLVRWASIALGLAVTFFVGEVLAFLAIGYGWFNGWTFYGTGASILIMSLAVVVVPIVRLLETNDT